MKAIKRSIGIEHGHNSIKHILNTFHSTFYILLYFLRESLASDDYAARPSLIALQEMMFSVEDNQKVPPPPPCGESIEGFFLHSFFISLLPTQEVSVYIYEVVTAKRLYVHIVQHALNTNN